MDLRKEVLFEHSKSHTQKIIDWVGDSPIRFDEVMDLFLHDNYRVTQRLAWVIGIIGEQKPDLIIPWIAPMLQKTLEPNVHDAVKRNVLRILQFVQIPEAQLGMATTICFDLLSDMNEAIAIRVFAMTVLHNICKKIPELKSELKLVIEDQIAYTSAAFKNRGAKILKALN